MSRFFQVILDASRFFSLSLACRYNHELGSSTGGHVCIQIKSSHPNKVLLQHRARGVKESLPCKMTRAFISLDVCPYLGKNGSF